MKDRNLWRMRRWLIAPVVGALLLGQVTTGVLAQSERIFTVQVFSGYTEKGTVRMAKLLEGRGISGVRVEKIEGVYTVRVGKFATREEGRPTLARIRKAWPGAFLRVGFNMVEREVYGKSATPPVAGEKKKSQKVDKQKAGTITAQDGPPVPSTAATLPEPAKPSKDREFASTAIADAAPLSPTMVASLALPADAHAQAIVRSDMPLTPPVSARSADAPAPLPGSGTLQHQADRLFNEQRYGEAADLYRESMRQNPADLAGYERAYRRLAECYYQAGIDGENPVRLAAVDHYKAVLRNWPDPREANAVAYYRLGKLYHLLKFFYESQASYQAVITKYPNSHYAQESFFQIGFMNRQVGRLPQAAETYRGYLAKYPEGEYVNQALNDLASIYFEMRDIPNAIESYRTILKRTPNLKDVPKDILYAIGYAFYSRGLHGDTIRILSAYLSLYPDSEKRASALYILGCSFHETNASRTALRLYSEVLEKHPGTTEAKESALAMANLGTARGKGKGKVPMNLYGVENYLDPLSTYDRMLAESTSEDMQQRVIFLKGEAMTRFGRHADAVDVFLDLWKYFPQGTFKEVARRPLKTNVGHLVEASAAKEDDLTTADLYFRTAWTDLYGPSDAELLLKVASALFRMGLRQDAEEALKKVAATDPKIQERILTLQATHSQKVPAEVQADIQSGNQLVLEKKYKEALAVYEKSLPKADAVQKRWLLLGIGKAQAGLGQWKEAEMALSSIKGPGDDPFWTRLSDFSVEESRWGRKYDVYLK